MKPYTPTQVVEQWIIAFNKQDVARLQELYAEDAVNHQMPNVAAQGKYAIGKMFEVEFAQNP